MNRQSSRLLLCTLTAAVVVTATDASAFPNPFKRREPDNPLAPAEMHASESSAGGLLKQAQDMEAAGKSGAAASSYKKIVDRYPLTSFAPVAQFRLATAYERDGKYTKAFDTYQELVDTYKQSPQFGEAIDRQMAIASQARTEKLGSFLGIAKKLDTAEQISMFERVIGNAPRGRRAAEAQFEIAKIHEEQNEKDAAIAAYTKVVEDYPSSPLAADAQSKIGKGYIGKVQDDGSRDAANIDRARRSAEEASSLFPDQTVPDLSDTRTQIDDLAAESAFKTGKFYDKSGNSKAALLYYSEVMRSPGSSHFDEARSRISSITAQEPKLMDTVPMAALTAKDLAVQAAVDLKSKANYFGPPPPPARVASNVLRKPKMRTGTEAMPVIPLDEPDLPTGTDSVLKPDDSLLNPASLEPPTGTPTEDGDLKPGDMLPTPGTPDAGAAPGTLPPPSEPTLPPPSEPAPPADPPKTEN